MRRIHSVTLVGLLGGLLFVASGQAPAKHQGVLSVLHTGQAISLKNAENGYEISFMKNGSGVLGHKVVEVFSDGVVIEDLAGVNQTRIPIYSIKSVVVIKVGGAR